MTTKYHTLLGNNPWDLLPPPRNTNNISDKWFFHHKLKPDGSLDRYKAPLGVLRFLPGPRH
jgi:hypothetical protein